MNKIITIRSHKMEIFMKVKDFTISISSTKYFDFSKLLTYIEAYDPETNANKQCITCTNFVTNEEINKLVTSDVNDSNDK